MKRVLVIGGAGSFGRHLVRGLAGAGFVPIVAGRDLARAEAAARAIGSPAEAVALDRDLLSPQTLRASGAELVVDAAGPFEAEGYRVIEAALAAGLSYLDLADSRGFVAGITRFDVPARAAGLVVLAGASSTPALSNAVLDRLVAGWQRVERVEIAIAPGNRAPRGLSVVRSILAYAGQKVRVKSGGRWEMLPGWGLLARRRLPGLGSRLLSLVETPDLDLVPARFADVQTALFRAGLELPFLHLGLSLASLPVRWGRLRSLAPAAAAFRSIADLFRGWGSDRGGMLVEVAGLDAGGQPVQARWSLVAEAGEGPVIPTLPALAAIRLIAAGAVAPGARACAGFPDLPAIEAEFTPYRIRTMIETEPAALFARALGADFARLPAPLQALHQPGLKTVFAGRARVEGAATWLGRIAAWFFGFPGPADDVTARVTIAASPQGEIWLRDFAGRRFRSHLRLAWRGDRIEERFGLFTCPIALRVDDGGLDYIVDGWRLGPLPLPRRLAPIARARETADEAGRACFDVTIRLPLIGRLVRYRGWIEQIK